MILISTQQRRLLTTSAGPKHELGFTARAALTYPDELVPMLRARSRMQIEIDAGIPYHNSKDNSHTEGRPQA